MDRLTYKIDNIYAIKNESINILDNCYTGAAIEKLALLEDMIDKINIRQIELTKELDKFKEADNTKSYKFKELMAEKFTNSKVLSTLDFYGIK